MKRAAVTGATGLIGSSLIRRLSGMGVETYAFARPHSTRIARSIDADDPYVTVVLCDGAGYADLAAGPRAKEMPRIDVFFHLAWDGTIGPSRNDSEQQQRSVDMALDAVRLARSLGARRFVFAGSQAQYGLLADRFSASTPCNPVTAYGKAKLLAEEQTRALCHEYGIEHVSARIGSAYGPADSERTVIMQAMEHALDNVPFACTKAEQLWDHIFCDDAAEALRLMAETGRPDAVYPVGTGNAEPLRKHIELACKACNPAFEPDFGAMDYPENQVMFLCADIEQLVADTGFVPRVSFEEGIQRTAEWYCKTRSGAHDGSKECSGGLNAI